MRYEVMRRGHKVGHHKLTYGSTVTARQLGVKDDDLRPFVARGVLKPKPVKIVAASEPSGEKAAKTDKKAE